MGQARRRPARRRGRPPARRTGRRPARRGPSLATGAGTVVAVLAAGLVVLGAPATELAAQVTASWSPFRTAGPANQIPRVPQVPQAIEQTTDFDVPDPTVRVPGVALPVPRDLDVEFVPPTVPRGIIPEYHVPEAPCGGYSSPRRIVPAVVPGAGSATLSWMADSDNETVRGYRVQAVSQQLVAGLQPAPPQQLVPQRDDCGEVTTTMIGLAPGVPYVFWLEEEVWDPEAQVTEFVQVGSTTPVVIG